MHFSFNVLRIKGLYMFRAILTHPQEVLHKRHLVYCVRMSVGLWHGCSETATMPQLTDIIRTHYTQFRLCSTCWGWASNARNIYRPLILNRLNEKCITLVTLYWLLFKIWPLSISSIFIPGNYSYQSVLYSLGYLETLDKKGKIFIYWFNSLISRAASLTAGILQDTSLVWILNSTLYFRSHLSSVVLPYLLRL
jgi:hypothetical protein